jgi:signal peptidase I
MTHDEPEFGATPARGATASGPAYESGNLAGAGQPSDAADEPSDSDEQVKQPKQRRSRSLARELPILIGVALIIALIIKTFVVQAFFIPSGSMQDTLHVNDRVLVNKLVYDFRSIKSGDIVVFDGAGSWSAEPVTQESSNPIVHAYDDTLRPLFHAIGGLFGTAPGQTDFIKRVIGVPGDHVVCCNAQGLITVNGVPLHEQSYLYPGNHPSSHPGGIPGHFNVIVPAGRLWVLGDHRAISDDSRGHETDPGGGTIPVDRVIGRAFVVVWPPKHWRLLQIPSTFSQPGIAAGTAAAGRGSARAVVAALDGTRVKPSAPYLPLAAGFAAAVPVTWLQRRARRRLMARLRRSRGGS